MLNLIKKVDLAGYTLIVPSVSVGNVGQLTVDLLINSLQMEKIGTIWDSEIIPILGADPYTNSCNVSISCELYISSAKKLAALQIRSGLYRNSKRFLNKLSKIINEHQFSNVIIITSCFAYEQHYIKSSQFRYIANELMLKEYDAKLNSLDWQRFENQLQNCKYDDIKLNGGGFGIKLFQELDKERIKCLLVMKYCSEGDNIPDAVLILNYLNKFIEIFEDIYQQICYPSSWNLLFGSPPPIGIY